MRKYTFHPVETLDHAFSCFPQFSPFVFSLFHLIFSLKNDIL